MHSDMDPFDLVERDLASESVAELGSVGGFVPGAPGRAVDVAAVSPVLRDPDFAEAVGADPVR